VAVGLLVVKSTSTSTVPRCSTCNVIHSFASDETRKLARVIFLKTHKTGGSTVIIR
jgi:hypothetical protein